MQIFEQTHHPTRYQIASICDSLNSLACRKDKKPLEPYNIQYWFKNARAALRRKVKGEKQTDSSGANISSSNLNLASGGGGGNPTTSYNGNDFDLANFGSKTNMRVKLKKELDSNTDNKQGGENYDEFDDEDELDDEIDDEYDDYNENESYNNDY